MREIKFRGKSVNHGEWVYGKLHGFGIDLFDEPVKEDTICQFTGLYDKYGKQIYEGDILGADERIIGWIEGGVRGYCYDVVFINHPAGEKRWTLYGTVKTDFPNNIEVIGNIFDNKDLLED